MQNYERLEVWKAAHSVTLQVYKLTKRFPSAERRGLVGQMRRSAVSVPSNIAEGAGRRSAAEFAHFLSIAIGSANELAYQVGLSTELGYLSAKEGAWLKIRVEGVRRMLVSLAAKVRASHRTQNS